MELQSTILSTAFAFVKLTLTAAYLFLPHLEVCADTSERISGTSQGLLSVSPAQITGSKVRFCYFYFEFLHSSGEFAKTE